MIIEKIAMAAFENAISKKAMNPFANPAFVSAAKNGSRAAAKKAKPIAASAYKEYGKPIGRTLMGMGESIGYTVKHPGKVMKSFMPGGSNKIRNKGIIAMSTAGGAGAMATLAIIARGEKK